jgi:hypothetical protein
MSYLVPVGLFALALTILAVGLPFSRRFLRRGRYITGIILIALSFAIFWPVQVVFSEWVEKWGVYGVLALLPLLLSLFLFSGGVGLVSKANNTPRDDYYDNLFS